MAAPQTTSPATDAKRKAAEALIAALPLPEGEAGWARDVRAAARTRLLEAGAPGRRDEYWRFTDPARLVAPMAAPEGEGAAVSPDPFPGIDAVTVAFVNGRHRADLSAPLPEGVVGASLAEVMAQDISIARELFGRLELAGQEKVARPLATLNTAAARDGLVLQVTGPVATPIHLAHAQAGAGAALLRHLVRVESGASVTLLESGHAANTVIEVDVAPGGTFHHLRVAAGERPAEARHIFARVGEGGVFKSFTLMA
ncbi:MAG: Fe-S cluster assembly protein SufD, partial [Pseudomonadota bacterium]